MARKKGCEHGQMLYSADGYVTAWFMWQLKSDQNAAKALKCNIGDLVRMDDSTILRNQD